MSGPEMDSSLTFSDQEIQEELSRLGYNNIPFDKLKEFQRDLNQLVLAERSKSRSENSFGSDNGAATGPDYKEDLVTMPMDAPQDRNNAAEVVGVQHFPLRREDLEQHELRQDMKSRERSKVPGHFALFELPPKVQHLRDDVSETESEIRRMKRKTLRKNEEGAKFIDESMSDIDTGSIIEAHERMQRMVLRDLHPMEPRRSQSARSRETPPPYRLGPDDPRPPSVIYSSFDHPHTKNLRRADPVARYHQMQQAWNMQQAPGESQRKGLRWNVREQMLTQFVPEKKPQRKYVPNNYVPPPDKPRKALRWQIRMDMA